MEDERPPTDKDDYIVWLHQKLFAMGKVVSGYRENADYIPRWIVDKFDPEPWEQF
jgi:hypothetical protein